MKVWPWLAAAGAICAAEVLRRRETETITVSSHAIFLPEWPAELDGFRVLVVSDLHVHPRATAMGRRETRLADILSRIDCDVLLVPGDSANTPNAARVAVQLLKHAQPRHGTYFTLGNGENKPWADTNSVIMELQRGGTVLLNDRMVFHINGIPVYILGVDDPSEDRDRLDKAGRGIPENRPRILLAHSPEIVTRLHRVPVDLVVCGHTHGGQVCKPDGRAIWTQTETLGFASLDSGLFHPGDMAQYTTRSLERTRMYVSRGVGTAKLAIRAFCRPEIALLTLRSGRA